MTKTMWSSLIESLQQERFIEFDEPLTDEEFAAVEQEFEFQFPPDLRAFLQTGLPVSRKFPDWRNGDRDKLREQLGIPGHGMLFDVERNGFWLDDWGPRPSGLEEAFAIVRSKLQSAPKLIPIYAHRMMPDRPCEHDNPVFSVHQTDIIYYGINLRDYLIHEFFANELYVWPIPEKIKPIEFWDIRKFHEVRWDENGMARFDNRRGLLP